MTESSLRRVSAVEGRMSFWRVTRSGFMYQEMGTFAVRTGTKLVAKEEATGGATAAAAEVKTFEDFTPEKRTNATNLQ